MNADQPPEVNTLVDVRFDDGREFPSRVEDGDGDRLVLAAPFGGGIEPPEIGTVVDVCWTSRRGRYVAPVRLLEIRHAKLAFWVVEIAGWIELQQRRNFVRAGGGEPVRIRTTDPRDTSTLIGRIVDISEGGLRCWVNPAPPAPPPPLGSAVRSGSPRIQPGPTAGTSTSAGTSAGRSGNAWPGTSVLFTNGAVRSSAGPGSAGSDPPNGGAAERGAAERGAAGAAPEADRPAGLDLSAGQRVTVTVGLNDEELSITGEVLRVINGRTGQGLDMVIVFDLAEGAAGVVRRYVMRSQLLARRLAAESS